MNLYHVFTLFFVLSVSNYNSVHAIEPVSILTIFSAAKAIDFVFEKSYDFYKLFSKNDDPFNFDTKEIRLYQSISNVTSLVKNLEYTIPQMTIVNIKQLERDFSEIIHFEIVFDDLIKHINRIESMYDQFLSKFSHVLFVRSKSKDNFEYRKFSFLQN